MVLTDGTVPSPSQLSDGPRPFRYAVDLWLPRRFFSDGGVDLAAFVTWVNHVITTRGFITYDGQVLTSPVIDSILPGMIRPEPPESVTSDDEQWLVTALSSCRRIGAHTHVVFELRQPDGDLDLSPFEVPAKREWGDRQREFFRLDDPYQMIEDAADYTACHIDSWITRPYLDSGESIVGLVHGTLDTHLVNCCRCHQADIVYTTRHRLVCMGCGALHAVLCEGLAVSQECRLTPDEWRELFDPGGSRSDEEIDLPIVDFRDLEAVPMIWTTDAWNDTKREFVFFARSSPNDVAAAIRGTERDHAMAVEAGFLPVGVPPAVAEQLGEDSVDVDLVENAGHALRDGVRWFVMARNEPTHLVNAIPQLFRAVELLLKARLQELDSQGLLKQPNNPKVISTLEELGVQFPADELDALKRLRRLRNDLQHGTAKFNYRRGLTLARRSILLAGRLALEELELWMGDILDPGDLWAMLQIKEFATTAERVAMERIEDARASSSSSTVWRCGRCERETMLRMHPRAGAACVYCGQSPEPTELGASEPDLERN